MDLNEVLETVRILINTYGDAEGCIGINTKSISMQLKFGEKCTLECGVYNRCERCMVTQESEQHDGVEFS